MKTEKIIVGAGTEYPLNGMLTLPDARLHFRAALLKTGFDLEANDRWADLPDAPETPVPAAVLVHGSGPSNMDEKIYSLTPFRDLAEGLAARGIATLRYDKRTLVYAGQMKKQAVTVWEETIEDALRAAA